MSLKSPVRRHVKSILAQLSSAELIDQSLKAAVALRQLPVYRDASTIGFYMSMDASELKTSLMIRNAFEDGKKVFLPRCHFQPTLTAFSTTRDYSKSAKKNHLVFHHMPSLTQLLEMKPQGPYKLKEPSEDLPDCFSPEFGGIDLLIMPGVAFSINTSGGVNRIKRLGHGAGFYDEFVARHKKYVDDYNEAHSQEKKYPFLLGACLKEQLVEDVPTDELDEDLNGLLITDKFHQL